MQLITITGHIGRDPETRQAGAGAVCNFSVACNEGKDTPPTWYRVGVWGRQGEAAQKMLAKGRKVIVSGRLKASVYEGKLQLDVSADAWEFADSRPEGGQGYPAAMPDQRPAAPPIDDDSLPF